MLIQNYTWAQEESDRDVSIKLIRDIAGHAEGDADLPGIEER